MPRRASESAALISDLTSRIQRALDAARAQGVAEGRAQALLEIRDLVGSSTGPRVAALRGVAFVDSAPLAAPGDAPAIAIAPAGASPSLDLGSLAPSKPRKNPWAGLTPAERLARVNAIRLGRGLPAREA